MGPAIGGDWVAIPSQIFRDSCESCRKTKGLQRGERRGIKGTSRHVVSDTCSHFVSWSLADWEPSFCLYSDMVVTWYPSLAIYALTELGCGQPNKPRWDCMDMRQGDHVPALEGLFILHVKLQVYQFTSSFHFLPNPTQTSGSQ